MESNYTGIEFIYYIDVLTEVDQIDALGKCVNGS
jgi:hypothetical protein